MEGNEKLPMNWWNFCKYFRFPVGILYWGISIISSFRILIAAGLFEMGIGSILIVIEAMIIPIAFFIFLIITYASFLKESPLGYKLIMSSLFVEAGFNTMLNLSNLKSSEDFTRILIIDIVVWGLIYIWPNYVYFKKRKYVFYKNSSELKNKVETSETRNEDISDNEKLRKELLGNKSNKNEDMKKRQKRKETDKSNKVIEEEKDKQEKNAVRYCTHCGKKIDVSWTFCNYCGNKLK